MDIVSACEFVKALAVKCFHVLINITHMSCIMSFCIQENRVTQISCAVIAQLIYALDFATQKVHSFDKSS